MRRSRFAALIFTLALCTPVPARAAWEPNGNIVTPHTFTESGPQVASDGRGGVFVTLEGFFTGPLVQRFGPDGSPAPGWSERAKTSTGSAVTHGVSRPSMPIPDGTGGSFMVWMLDDEFCVHGCGSDPGRLRVLRLTARGAPAPGWPAAGVIVSEHLSYPVRTFEACSDGAHGVWITWQSDAFLAQHIGPQGELLRVPEPVVANSAGWQSRPRIVGDAHGGAYVFWAEGAANAFPSGAMRGQHFTADGRPRWGETGRQVSTESYDLSRDAPPAVQTREGDAVVAWIGVHGADPDVFATRVDRQGSRVWREDRVVCGAPTAQRDVHVVAEPGDAVLIAWRDARPASGVFAQRLDGKGRPQWTRDGVAVCAGAGTRTSLVACADGQGGAFLAWTDRDAPWSVLATRLDARGGVGHGWPADPAPVCARSNHERGQDQASSLGIVAAGPGSAMVCWTDLRIPPTVSFLDEASFVMRLGRGGPAASPELGPGPPPAPAALDLGVPAPAFALRTIFPNPSHGDASVRFSLADDSPATLDVFDVLGRRVVTRDAGGAAGERTVALSPGRALAPGIYLVRLRQRARIATSRVVVTR
jgi:hypothetical protein